MHPLLRFTLDLFGSNQPLEPVHQAPVATNDVANKRPVRIRSKKRIAVPALPPENANGLFVTHFSHPQATREVRLGAALVAYEFKRGQRRSIGFSIGPHGLAVRAPKWAPLHEVDAALQAKAAWILRKLQETSQRHAQQAAQQIDWREGAQIPYLGQQLTLEIDPEHRFAAGGAALVCATQQELGSVQAFAAATPVRLCVSLARSANADQIRDAVQAWLMRQAKRIFQERLDHFAPLLGVQCKKLSLSHAATRWGSAKSDGSIRLNWRLVHFNMAVLDYVVVHELSHLRVMNHSPKFWATVHSVVPNYAQLRQQLKDNPVPRWE